MWLDDQPRKVKATPESVARDYEILKKNLPIPIGIDHLKPETLQKNPILDKMNLLNVGVIHDVKLENNEIQITRAEITNPTIKELYDQGELPYFSQVSDMKAPPCPSPGSGVDNVEEYSVIKRVDFVERGACTQCTTGINRANAEEARFNAKAIIGDDKLSETESNQTAGEGEGEGEVTLETIAQKLDTMEKAIGAFDERIKKLEEPPQEGEEGEGEGEGEAGEAGEADPKLTELEKEIQTLKATAAKAEATSTVKAYLKEGKIEPKSVEKHIAMAMATPTEYKELMDDAPVIIDLERHSTPGQGEASDSVQILDEEGNEVDMAKVNQEIDTIIKTEKGSE